MPTPDRLAIVLLAWLFQPGVGSAEVPLGEQAEDGSAVEAIDVEDSPDGATPEDDSARPTRRVRCVLRSCAAATGSSRRSTSPARPPTSAGSATVGVGPRSSRGGRGGLIAWEAIQKLSAAIDQIVSARGVRALVEDLRREGAPGKAG